ncbi:MAG: choice-of-anchor D domain-containing protein [Terriglobales bacterium]
MRLPREACTFVLCRRLPVPLITLIVLLGLAPAKAQVTAKPPTLAFGNVPIGNKSTLPVVLTNNGSSTVSITGGRIQGAGFRVTGIKSPIVLDAGQTFTLNISFAPRADGAYSGVVSGSGSSGLIVSIPVTGNGTGSGYSVNLSWDPSVSQVSGYNVYRATQVGGPYTKLNSVLDPGTTYIDYTVLSGNTYYYATRAVNSSGQESTASNLTEAVIP